MLRLLFVGLVLLLVWRMIMQALRASDRPGESPRPHDKVPPRRAAVGMENPYRVLEIQPGASQADIREAYQRLVQQYHPDKVAGLGPDLQALAEQRTKEINVAYATLRER